MATGEVTPPVLRRCASKKSVETVNESPEPIESEDYGLKEARLALASGPDAFNKYMQSQGKGKLQAMGRHDFFLWIKGKGKGGGKGKMTPDCGKAALTNGPASPSGWIDPKKVKGRRCDDPRFQMTKVADEEEEEERDYEEEAEEDGDNKKKGSRKEEDSKRKTEASEEVEEDEAPNPKGKKNVEIPKDKKKRREEEECDEDETTPKPKGKEKEKTKKGRGEEEGDKRKTKAFKQSEEVEGDEAPNPKGKKKAEAPKDKKKKGKEEEECEEEAPKLKRTKGMGEEEGGKRKTKVPKQGEEVEDEEIPNPKGKTSGKTRRDKEEEAPKHKKTNRRAKEDLEDDGYLSWGSVKHHGPRAEAVLMEREASRVLQAEGEQKKRKTKEATESGKGREKEEKKKKSKTEEEAPLLKNAKAGRKQLRQEKLPNMKCVTFKPFNGAKPKLSKKVVKYRQQRLHDLASVRFYKRPRKESKGEAKKKKEEGTVLKKCTGPVTCPNKILRRCFRQADRRERHGSLRALAGSSVLPYRF